MAANADQKRQEVVARLGVALPHASELAERLLKSISSEAGGLPFFEDLPFHVRAVVSDQLVGAARAIEVNLVEARIHESNRAAIGEGGFGFPVTSADHERAIRYEAEGVAFFRAVGSALDCFAAVVVGLLRVPVSIRRASFGDVLRVDPRNAPDEELKRIWGELRKLIAREANSPTDWLAWTLEMRHAVMHRARLMHILVARPTESLPLALPAQVAAELVRERLRADSHFRRKPWLPDMQHLADAQAVADDAILREPEAVTLRGIADATNRLVELCSACLLDNWAIIEKSDIPSPVGVWLPEAEKEIDFRGFIPDHELPPMSAMVISPRDSERVRLAIRLREDLAGGEAEV